MVQFEKSRYIPVHGQDGSGLQLEKVRLPFQCLDKIEANQSWSAFILLVGHSPFEFSLDMYKNPLQHGDSSNSSTQNKFKSKAKIVN